MTGDRSSPVIPAKPKLAFGEASVWSARRVPRRHASAARSRGHHHGRAVFDHSPYRAALAQARSTAAQTGENETLCASLDGRMQEVSGCVLVGQQYINSRKGRERIDVELALVGMATVHSSVEDNLVAVDRPEDPVAS